MNITVDQSLYYKDKKGTGEHYKVAKEPSAYYGLSNVDQFGAPLVDNHKTNPDPFLFSDTKVMTGTGKALVCCVGNNTLLALTRKPDDLVTEEQKTFLETKLDIAATQISKFAKFAAGMSFVTRMVFIFIKTLASGEEFTLNGLIYDIAVTIVVAVVLLMVAVPEGLPLAISLAMALSIKNLKDDEILIKNMEAV
jgi:Ca2+-transporting ATPase